MYILYMNVFLPAQCQIFPWFHAIFFAISRNSLQYMVALYISDMMFMHPGCMFWHFGRRREVFRCALPTSQVAGITEASLNRGWFVYRTVSIKGVWFWPWWWCQIQWILQRNESRNGGCTGKCLGQLNSEGLFEGHFVDKIVPGT